MLIAALSVALVPEGLQLNSLIGRSSDSLEPVAFPYGWAVQWLDWQTLCGLTAAGTVADSHGIPLAKSPAKVRHFSKMAIANAKTLFRCACKVYRNIRYFCSRFVVSPCGLNRESGVNPGQFPLLCWLQRLPWRHWKPCLSGRRQEKTSVRRPASSRETRLPGIGAGILFFIRYALSGVISTF